MSDAPIHSISGLPWSTDLRSLVAEAATCEDGAACLFVIAADIPPEARPGYAALVVAYTRDGEPVAIFDDGSALLLIREGGVPAARIAAERIVGQMNRLGLASTLRVGVVGVDAHPDSLGDRARERALSAEPGAVAS